MHVIGFTFFVLLGLTIVQAGPIPEESKEKVRLEETNVEENNQLLIEKEGETEDAERSKKSMMTLCIELREGPGQEPTTVCNPPDSRDKSSIPVPLPPVPPYYPIRKMTLPLPPSNCSQTPQHPPSSDVPQNPPSSDVPQYPPSSNVPQNPPSSDVPQNPPSSNVPQYPPSSNVPQYPPSSDVPQNPPSSNVPQYPPSSNVPQYPPSSDVPQNPPSSNVPQYPPSSNVPQNPPCSNVPQNSLTSDVPQNPPTSNIPQNPPSSNVPQNPPSSDVPQYPPSSDVPQYPPSSDVPQNPPCSNVPQNPPTSNVPQNPPSSDVPQNPPSIQTLQPQIPQIPQPVHELSSPPTVIGNPDSFLPIFICPVFGFGCVISKRIVHPPSYGVNPSYPEESEEINAFSADPNGEKYTNNYHPNYNTMFGNTGVYVNENSDRFNPVPGAAYTYISPAPVPSPPKPNPPYITHFPSTHGSSSAFASAQAVATAGATNMGHAYKYVKPNEQDVFEMPYASHD